MHVSFVQGYEKTGNKNGYGYARQMCEDSLKKLGHDVSYMDPKADVEINFIQPDLWAWGGADYRIGYLPWESTKLREHWIEPMENVDEIWTPSPVVAQWFEDEGITRPIYVYQHGVEPRWVNRKRHVDGTLQVLHHGAEALRKGGNDTIRAFMDTLWQSDAQLVLKMLLQQFNLHDSKHIRLERGKMEIDELVALYQACHLMVYPSWGEGFGLTPLQAMATGMPVLITKGWAPYEYLLPEECLIESELVPSPWEEHHPGKMFKPDQADLRAKLADLVDNYEYQSDFAYNLAPKVHQDYDWVELTRKAFAHLEFN